MTDKDLIKNIRHTVLCEISLGWATKCDCGADFYKRNLKRAAEASKSRVPKQLPGQTNIMEILENE